MGTLVVDLGCFPFGNETYLTLPDSLVVIYDIRSLIRFGRLRNPRIHSVLYLHISSLEASPKAISRRTSYIPVRLEFLRYPQVIPGCFNRRGFGPPQGFTLASTCSRIGHWVSGLQHATKIALFRLAFASAPQLNCLTLQHTVTRRPVLQKVRGRYKSLPPIVNIWFQVLFHSPPGVLFTFPSRYLFAIGH